MFAVGYGPLSYEWKKDGKEITSAATELTGVDTNALIITSFSSSHQGSYRCLIHDGHKSITTQPTSLELSKNILLNDKTFLYSIHGLILHQYIQYMFIPVLLYAMYNRIESNTAKLQLSRSIYVPFYALVAKWSGLAVHTLMG